MYDINDFVADSGKFHPNVTNMQIVGLDSSSGYSGQRIMFLVSKLSKLLLQEEPVMGSGGMTVVDG